MKIGFIGTGNMGGALAAAVAKSDGKPTLLLADFDAKKATALADALGATVADNLTLCKECDMVFLGVKPQVLGNLLKEIAPVVSERGNELTLVSMAAGISLEKIGGMLGCEASLIRIMPNTPVSVGKGVIVYDTFSVSAEKEAAFCRALTFAGLVEKLDESKIDAASALHGCGPAFVYLFLEALADGGVACGLPRDAALRFAAATAAGASEMVLKTGKHPGELKDAVCSPGGTTIQGVRTLEEMGFRGAAMDAVIAAFDKTLELGK
ncbi:MAG: pyrroline-5-carboxylate reductase [Clostridia bacterium]|nr:pyrroline-5-carboxylate reductase [Clostridia bacterium]